MPLREQHRRQPPPAIKRVLVLRAPGLEELDELLARGLLVPIALATNDLDEMVDGIFTLAACVGDERQIEARGMIVGVSGQTRFESRGIAELGGSSSSSIRARTLAAPGSFSLPAGRLAST